MLNINRIFLVVLPLLVSAILIVGAIFFSAGALGIFSAPMAMALHTGGSQYSQGDLQTQAGTCISWGTALQAGLGSEAILSSYFAFHCDQVLPVLSNEACDFAIPFNQQSAECSGIEPSSSGGVQGEVPDGISEANPQSGFDDEAVDEESGLILSALGGDAPAAGFIVIGGDAGDGLVGNEEDGYALSYALGGGAGLHYLLVVLTALALGVGFAVLAYLGVLTFINRLKGITSQRTM